MCAITGFSVLYPNRYNANAIKVLLTFASIWGVSEDQGPEASGLVILGQKGEVKELVKGPQQPWDQLEQISSTYAELRSISGIIAHTRLATSGAPTTNGNNHPLQFGDITGVHNGVLISWEKLHKELECKQKVDSEVLFALLDKAGNDLDGIRQIQERVAGSKAIAWARKGQDGISLFCNRSSTGRLNVAFDLSAGVAYFASELAWLPQELPSYRLESDCYLHLETGKVSKVLFPLS